MQPQPVHAGTRGLSQLALPPRSCGASPRLCGMAWRSRLCVCDGGAGRTGCRAPGHGMDSLGLCRCGQEGLQAAGGVRGCSVHEARGAQPQKHVPGSQSLLAPGRHKSRRLKQAARPRPDSEARRAFTQQPPTLTELVRPAPCITCHTAEGLNTRPPGSSLDESQLFPEFIVFLGTRL